MKRVAVLGATGSVGAGTLEVLRRHSDRFRVTALTANRSWEALDELALEWDPEFVVLGKPAAGFEPRWRGEWRVGTEALEDTAASERVDLVLNALVGFAGLGPTLAALASGKRLALANKESLVAGGDLVLRALREGGGELLPVDSEHSAVHQCIAGRPTAEIARITLTASGGPFRTWPAERLATVRPRDALSHPTWDMGSKITIDSATLANKALEVIEAHTLFGVPYDRIDVVVHPTSIVHSVVEFRDGSSLAQLGKPSMEIPILWALAYPDRLDDARSEPGFDPIRDGPLEFEQVREDAFPLFRAGVAAGEAGGEFPVAFNAANEVAVERFLAGRIGFEELAGVVLRTLEQFSSRAVESVDDVRQVDARARAIAREAPGRASAGSRNQTPTSRETNE